MIIRRLTDALRRQDWFQVTVEILIVVIGIFLGLQVTAWNDARLERDEEQSYLARLHQDFSLSVDNNEIRMDRVFKMWQFTKVISDSLASCELADEDKDDFAFGLYGFGKFIQLTLSGTAIDELKSTGKFQIIQNEEIRNAISQNITTIANQAEIADAVYVAILPHINSIEKQYSHKVTDADPTFPFTEPTWDTIEIDFEQLCQSQEIKNSVSQIFKYMRGYSNRAYVALEQQRTIMEMLEAEMEQTP